MVIDSKGVLKKLIGDQPTKKTKNQAEKKAEIHKDLSERPRMPRDTLDDATKSYREEFDLGSEFDATHFRNILGSKENLEIWKAVVKDHFEEYWTAAASRDTKKRAKGKDKEKGKDKDEAGEEEDDETEKDEGLRTCSATLKQILRSDIQDHHHLIVDIIEDNQVSLSTCVDELSALTQKSTLAVSTS